LPSAVQAIIARQPKGSPDDYVFQPVRGSGPLSLNKPWRAIRAAASLPSDMGIHGLRHALGTLMAIQGAEAPQIMAALGHTQISTTRRYINIADQAKAELMERHTAGITAMMNEQAPAPVVEFKRKG
jgi:integrase